MDVLATHLLDHAALSLGYRQTDTGTDRGKSIYPPAMWLGHKTKKKKKKNI